MSTNKLIIKTCMKIMILLLLIISISNVSYAATYTGIKGVEEIVKSNPSDMINKDIFLKYSDLKNSNYLYCLEQGQRMKESGSNYAISEYIEIDGEKATAMYKPSGKDWHNFSNENQYNAILALILNSDGQLGHGSTATDAQKALWSYFPYWIQKSGATLGTDNSWCSGSNWSAEYNGGSNAYVEKAMQAYANGERAKVKIYLLHNINGTESWQRLMIAIPEGITIPKDNDLVIKKIDKDTGEPLAGVEFKVISQTNSFIQASGPDANNVYQFIGYTTDSSKATKFKTGTNAYKDITIQNIPDDKYTIFEYYNPNLGYEINNGNEYVVDKTNNNNDEPCVITIKNEKTEKLIIKKIDEDTEQPLSGVEFVLKNDKNEYIRTNQPNSKNEYKFIGYASEQEATRFVTGINEYIPITIMELPNDVYTITEVGNANKGYADNIGHESVIEKKDNTTNADIEITIKNKKKENFIIEKVDKNTGAKLGGVEFLLWNDNKQFIQASGPDSENVYTFTGFTSEGDRGTRLKTGANDSYKPITITGLPDGSYTLKEIYNPILGYEANELREWKVVKEDSKSNEDCIVIAENESGEEKYEHKPTTVIGKVTISGFVWEDIALGKDNTINSKYDESEQKIQGIKVYWKDSNGEIIDSATTDANGYYEFAMELKFQNHPYKLLDEDKYNRINGSYVEFDYNGIKYTTVANTSDITKENVSQGIEIQSDRDALDNKFDLVENKQIIDNGNSIDTVDNLKECIEPNYLEKYAVTATTNKINNMLKIAETQEGWTKKTTFCTEHCEAGIRQHEIGRVELKKDGASATLILYCFGRSKIEFWSDPDGILNDEINAYLEAPIGEEINKYDAHYYSAGEKDGPAKKDCKIGEEYVYEWNIKNVNLGLVRREQPDLAITSDIEKVRVIMKDQEYTYIYGNRGIQDNDESFKYKVQFGNKYLETYSRPVNPADVAYIQNPEHSNDLKVYVTYNILAKNESNTLYMKPNNVVNYYDSNYTIYTGNGSVTSEGWTENAETVNGYKVAYNESLSNTILEPGQKSEILKIEFEVSQEKIIGLLNEDAPFKNVSEITSYTTYYGDRTSCAENETAKVKEKVGKLYGGIDIDSITGNAIPGDTETYEDDTDQAPAFLLNKDKDPNPDPDPGTGPDPDPVTYSILEYKIISGTVWEDSQTAESADKNERLGDGTKSETEKGVANVKVELLLAETGEIAKLYRIENGEVKTTDAVTYTDANGNYSFGNNSRSTREGVVTDKYIIRYTYGNDLTTNARNYKSTIITTSPLKEVMKGEVNNDKWYLTIPDNESIAVDDLKQRLAIPSLQYSNFNDSISMTAYSKPFELKIEFTEGSDSQVGNDGGQFEHDWTRFDFGIIERPREDLVVDKTVSYIKLTLANGQVIEGDPREGSLNYVKAPGFKEVINNRQKSLAALDRLLTLELDTELIQGSTLDVTYAVTVTNNSELDYEYDENKVGYYYYGEISKDDKIIEQSVELLVDYLDSDLVCDVGENTRNEHNKNWKTEIDEKQVTAEYLKDNGYISYKLNESDTDRTYETLKKGDYTILVSEKFKDLAPGESHTEYLSAKKLLANNEGDNVFGNHVEILKLDGKIARTIDSVENGKQITKIYKPGNYIPSFANRTTNEDGTLEVDGLHQLDDNRVRIVVSPPTGISNYITIYIIATLIALIVIVGGIIFIKKKVITK